MSARGRLMMGMLGLMVIGALVALSACTKVVDARGIGADNYKVQKSDLEGGLFGDPPKNRDGR